MTERDQQPGPAQTAQSWNYGTRYTRDEWNAIATADPIARHALTISLDPILIGLLRQSLPGQPPPDADPLAVIINAGVCAILERIAAMSMTLSQQLDAATQAIRDDVAAVSAEVTALLAGVTPGSTITQAQVDALNAIDASLKAIPAATPPAQPAPPVTP